MLLCIPNVLNKNQLTHVAGLLADAPYLDGKLSAGSAARVGKQNEELDPSSEIAKELNSMVMGTVYHNPQFQAAALPHRVSTAFFARYSKGMQYGEHVDNSIMGSGNLYRSDLAVTVFLNDPDSYMGGELVIRTAFGDKSIKLPAGDAVIYPASSRHFVSEVTDGERLVAVAWVQSLVREADRREILFDLCTARDALLEEAPGHPDTIRLEHVYTNLVRTWSEL